jgi:predicted metal-dependent hydrolase
VGIAARRCGQPVETRWMICGQRCGWMRVTCTDTVEVVDEVEIRSSSRRKRTVKAYREGDKIVVLMPAHLSAAEEAVHVETLVASIRRKESNLTDAELMERAGQLSRRWLGGRAEPGSARWVGNQASRWGSCSTDDRTIRLSNRLQGMPQWVIDYVLLHELAHLIEANHGARFHALLADYPHTERAKGFLEGVTWQQR